MKTPEKDIAKMGTIMANSSTGYQSMLGNDIIKYLEALNDELKNKDVKGEMCMVGGAVMCLCFKSRPSTMDVDAIFEPKTIIYECAEIVARKYSIPKDWLNDGVKGFLSTKKDFHSYRAMSHLHVYAASPEYMLAMKCLSARLDNANELDDIKFLLKHLELSSFEKVISVITKYYPVDRFKIKTQYALQEILQEYE